MNILNTFKYKIGNGLNEVYKYLSDVFRLDNNQVTPASPFIQIINVLHNISLNMMSYLEDVVIEFNILKAKKIQSVHGLSRLVGHDPARAVCAKGKIEIKIKPEKITEIIGSYLIMEDGMTVTEKNSKLKYTVQLNKERMMFDPDNYSTVDLQIVQGEYDTQTVISSGEELQSFNIQGKKDKFIDQEYIGVYVNGFLYEVYESLYDMPYNQPGVLIKTGISGGIDIYFGNKNHGKIPPQGSEIEITYLEHNGVVGNVYGAANEIEFEWDEDIYDDLGNDVSVNEFFDVTLKDDIIFGANPETTAYTKLMAPLVSRTNILGNETSYFYYLNRMNIFSHINIFTLTDDEYLDDDNIIYALLIPKVERKLEKNDYFSLHTDSFVLSDNEIKKIKEKVVKSGKQIPGTELQIIKPKLRKYVVNVVLRVFDGYDETTLRTEVKDKLSKYFLAVNRRDKIPRSDLVRIIEKVDFVDSAFVEFISEDNEVALRKGYYFIETFTGKGIQKKKVNVQENTDPRLGIDEFGDIVINNGELPVIRGNFTDRNNNYYTEYFETGKTGPINIFINEVTDLTVQAEILNNTIDRL